MLLCFGTFAGILNYCKQRLSQDKFIPSIVWVVDKKNRCLGSGWDEVSSEALDKMDKIGNPAVVTRLLSCERGLRIRSKCLPSVEDASKNFKSKVMPYLDEDRIAKAVLAVLYIIDKDKTIATEHKENFRKYIGMDKEELLQKEKFDVPDFFARVLLYTTCIDNKEGVPYVREITDDIDAFFERLTKDSWAEAKWDATTQTVELIPTEQQRLWDEIAMISDLRLSMGKMEDEVYTDIDWLGIDKCALFPNKYRRIEFNDPETKKAVIDKMVRYRKLVQGLTDCLIAGQQSAKNKMARWPIFPDERIRNIRQQIKDLGEELELDLLKASIGF